MTMNTASHSDRWLARVPILGTRAARWDTVSLALGGVFLLTAMFYAWTAATSQPLSLHGGSDDRYNLLASAFLHLHLWVAHAPPELLHLKDPYNPEENRFLAHGPTDATSLGDDILYHGNLYFLWGPAPALVLLVPLHLLGFEPSASITVSIFAIAGLGFALAALRVLIRQIGTRSLWMCVIAGLAVAFSSVIPYLVRTPSVTEDTIAGGYCFTTAGTWLAISAIADRRASFMRLTLMSLCFGLAALSRPALGLVALILVPVYTSLRSPGRSHRRLLITMAGPVGVCFFLLLAYNQARFHQPLEFGAHYQLPGYDARTAPLGRLSYVLPGAWPYLANLPRPSILFPFLLIIPPSMTPPAGLTGPELTGGLLPMTPVVVFLVALPWLWRGRPAPLGTLAGVLIMLAGVGVVILLLPAYQFFVPTERYEVEFATLFVLGGVAGWLAASMGSPSRRRRLIRIGGGILAAWGCFAGWAISFPGSGNVLAVEHPGTWATLQDVGSPLSTLIATAAGHPVLASVTANNLGQTTPTSYTTLGAGATVFSLGVGEQADFTIVSPDKRQAALAAEVTQRHDIEAGYPVVGVHVEGPGPASHDYTLPAESGVVSIPIALDRGLNRFVLSPQPTAALQANSRLQVLKVESLSVTTQN